MFFNLTRSIGYGLKTKEIDSYDLFQFGKGDPTKSTTRAYIPSYLNNVPLVIGAGVLPERVPLLGSNSLLDKLGSVIDLPNRAVHFTALHCSVELHVKCVILQFSFWTPTMNILAMNLFGNSFRHHHVGKGHIQNLFFHRRSP